MSFDWLKCALNLHKFEVYKEETMADVRGNDVGKIIISRCTRCGKIRISRIRTVESY